MADSHNDIELAEDASATEHGEKKESPVAVKWSFNGNWRRFSCIEWTFNALMTHIRDIEPNFTGRLFYRDADGDDIVFSTDAEMRVMLDHFRTKLGKDTVAVETDAFCFSTNPANPFAAVCPAYNSNIVSNNNSKSPHPNIICDLCDRQLAGIRYKCFVCPDFDLCEQCEKTGAHGEHAMCRLATVDTPKPMGLPRPPLKLFPHWLPMHDNFKNGNETLDALQKRLSENSQKIAAKLEKLERKHAKHMARKEQRMQDHAARVQHRLDRSVANKMASALPKVVQHRARQPTAPPAPQVEEKQQEKKNITKKSDNNQTAAAAAPSNAAMKSANTPSAPPSLHLVDQAALISAIAKTQETLKKSLPVALSGLEATSAVISEFLTGFDPSTGQAANRVGQSVVGTARQSVENLTEKYLGKEFVANLLQLPATPTPNAMPLHNTTPTGKLPNSDNERHKVLNQLQAKLQSLQINKNGTLTKDNAEKEDEQNGTVVNNAVDVAKTKVQEAAGAKTSVVDGDATKEGPKDSVTAAAETLKIDTNLFDKQPPTSPVQLGNKRKLGDGMDKNCDDDLKLSSYNSANESQKSGDSLAQLNAETLAAESVVDLDMSSISSRSSATLSSGEDEEDSTGGDGWMVVKKESFKKLRDFYEKRRRLECDGGTVAADPFAVQLEHEFREAMQAINGGAGGGDDVSMEQLMNPSSEDSVEPQKANNSVIDEQLAPVDVAQIVDLSTEKNGSEKPEKKPECVHAVVMRGVCAGCGQDFRQPNELIGHSATILDFQQQQKPTQDNAANTAHQQKQPIDGDHQTAPLRIYPLLDAVPEPGFLNQMLGNSEVCTAGLPYPGYQKPAGQKHSRQCDWKHKNFVFQNVADQLVDMGFDNCNGWLFRVMEQQGPEMDRIFAAIDKDPMYCARVSLQ